MATPVLRRCCVVSPDQKAAAPHTLSSPVLWACSILVGIVAGLGAVGFRDLIGFFHNLLFLGILSANYDASAHTAPSPWGPFVILVPVAGAFVVAFLVKNFAPEAKGHGVPEVMDAVYFKKGIIRPMVSVIKAFASALSIGSGGSVGREGPIIQIGASFGSTVGQFLRTPAWQRITLIAAGAGGGIAATFNTPVGGVLFAVELIMHEVSARTLVPVVTATATATYIGRLFFGPHPSFSIPGFSITYFHLTNPFLLLAYAALGAITGLVSVLFISSIYGCESFFEKRVPGGYYVQHPAGMLAVGIIIYALMARFGHYYVEGVGYASIQDILNGAAFPLYLVALLFGLKLLCTSLTLGSGASGGVFSPALFLGATAGAAYGNVLHHLFPSLDISAPAFAVVGMGGVVGGSTGAAMAAIVMIFEMTLDYTVIVPLTLTVAISYGVRKAIIGDSIYTRKLTLRGDAVPETLRADLQFTHRAEGMMNRHVAVVPDSKTLRDIGEKEAGTAWIVTGGSNNIAGVALPENLAILEHAGPGSAIRDFLQKCVVVAPRASLGDVITAMESANAGVALVSADGNHPSPADVKGVITRKEILDAMASDGELFGG